MTVSGLQLPVKPYNGMWVDCVSNNLVGILSQINSSFAELPCSFAMNYTLLVPKELPSSATEIPDLLYREGMFTPKLTYQLPDLSDWIERIEIPTPLSDALFETIQDQLGMGRYLFVDLDRFHLPRGVDHQKKHRVHPCFIYGYDTAQNQYLLIEDCVKPGHFDYYRLTASELLAAFESAQELEASSMICYQTLPDADFNFITDKETVQKNIELLLTDREEAVQSDWQDRGIRHYQGISSLKIFADMIEVVYPRIEVWNEQQLVSITLPWQMQQRNLQLLDILEQKGFLNPMYKILLHQEYVDLSESWEKYRHKMFKYIILKEYNPKFEVKKDFFYEVKSELHNIAANEERVNRFLLDVLS